MARSDFQQVLKEFGEATGIAGLKLDEDSSCLLVLDETLPITLTWQEKACFLLVYVPVGRFDREKDNQDLFRLLLEANAPGGGSEGLTTLGIDVPCGLVLLSGRLDGFALDVPALAAFLERFAEQAEAWAGALAALRGKERTSGSDIPPAPVEGLRV